MSILPYQEIIKAIKKGKIKISPLDNFEGQVSSCRIDLRLGKNFKTFRKLEHSLIDLKNQNIAKNLMDNVVVNEFFLIHPGQFIIRRNIRKNGSS